jgi:hypothetical protein
MSTPSANQPQPKPSQGIPLWMGACIVGAVALAGGTFLTMQFLKEDPKRPTIRRTTRPAPGEPGGGPLIPPGGPAPPGMGGATGGGGKTGGNEAESDASKAATETPSK